MTRTADLKGEENIMNQVGWPSTEQIDALRQRFIMPNPEILSPDDPTSAPTTFIGEEEAEEQAEPRTDRRGTGGEQRHIHVAVRAGVAAIDQPRLRRQQQFAQQGVVREGCDGIAKCRGRRTGGAFSRRVRACHQGWHQGSNADEGER